jgi:hypothetical protein
VTTVPPPAPISTVLLSTNESVILAFDGPCRILELQIYYMGDNPAKDTLYIVGDAAEGAIPPTHWVWSYNTLTAPVVVDYSGDSGMAHDRSAGPQPALRRP